MTTKDADKSRKLPAFIKLQQDYADYRTGRVLRGDPDLLSEFDRAGVKYREATESERRIGGCV